MSKFLSMLVPALALTFATVQSNEAQASPHSVRAHAKAPARPVVKVWVPGHLELRAGRIIWVAGQYKVAPRANARYVKGHWEMKHGKRVWVSGYWR